MKQRGRKAKFYVGSDGRPVEGLDRMADGRWRCVETGFRFSEADEAKAIERFKKLTDADQESAEKWKRIDERPNIGNVPKLDDMIRIVCDEIRKRPLYVAKVGGIEQLAYLDTLEAPQVLPSLDELRENYKTNISVKNSERLKVLAAWDDFIKTTEVESLRKITGDVAIAYRRNIHQRGMMPKTQAHIFGRIRRVLTFAMSENIAIAACRLALDNLKLLKPNGSATTIAPNPISVSDWQAMLSKATGDDKAMILLALNCGAYLQEVVDFDWSNIDLDKGCLVARRKKKGQHLRVATLWTETLDALRAIKRRQGESIFIAETGLGLTVSGAGKRFRKLRKLAKVNHVQANQLRDGAATAATENKVEERFVNMMMGWKNSGVSDKYVLRNPSMVKPACDATYSTYMK